MGETKKYDDLNKEICSASICTACGACENICPKQCVERIEDTSYFHMVKGNGCVHCGLCEAVCPMKREAELNYPIHAYAAWSMDDTERKTSASGGVAAALYRYAIQEGCAFVGTYLDPKFECHLKMGKNDEDRKLFQNSKYTYSFPGDIYKHVAVRLKQKKKVLFVGLPCQIAAIKNYTEILKINTVGLLTVDIICHGTPMPAYLKQHIATLAEQYNKKPEKCFFRDTKFGTPNFVYTLYTHNSEEPFYKKGVDQDDLYQIGYHDALIYRDSCYQCKFAQPNRAGDITIGDFHVRDVDECNISIENTSTMLVNTDKGKQLTEELVENGLLHAQERKIEELIQGETQLRHPSIAPAERVDFLQEYEKKREYELAAKSSFKKRLIQRKLRLGKAVLLVKITIKAILPKKFWRTAKAKMKKY